MITQLCPPIYTYPSIHYKKIDMPKKNYVGLIRFPPPRPPPSSPFFMSKGKTDAMESELMKLLLLETIIEKLQFEVNNSVITLHFQKIKDKLESI